MPQHLRQNPSDQNGNQGDHDQRTQPEALNRPFEAVPMKLQPAKGQIRIRASRDLGEE